MTVYRWKNGSRVKVDAQTAGEACEALEREGNLTPAALVDASRDEDAPLHGCFEWNDEIAAERYRESQAAYIIRSVEVELSGSSEPVKAFVSVEVEGETREYVSIGAALAEPDTRQALLSDALDELKAIKRKYAQLKELAAVFAEIDKAVAA